MCLYNTFFRSIQCLLDLFSNCSRPIHFSASGVQLSARCATGRVRARHLLLQLVFRANAVFHSSLVVVLSHSSSLFVLSSNAASFSRRRSSRSRCVFSDSFSLASRFRRVSSQILPPWRRNAFNSASRVFSAALETRWKWSGRSRTRACASVGGHIPVVPLPDDDDDDDDDVDAKGPSPGRETSSNDLFVHITKARDHHHRVTHERVVLVVAISYLFLLLLFLLLLRLLLLSLRRRRRPGVQQSALSFSFFFILCGAIRDIFIGPKSSPQLPSHTTTLKARKTSLFEKEREREREESSSSLSFPEKKSIVVMRPGQHDVSSSRSLLVWVVLSLSVFLFLPADDGALLSFGLIENRIERLSLSLSLSLPESDFDEEREKALSLFFCSARRCFFQATLRRCRLVFLLLPLQATTHDDAVCARCFLSL